MSELRNKVALEVLAMNSDVDRDPTHMDFVGASERAADRILTLPEIAEALNPRCFCGADAEPERRCYPCQSERFDDRRYDA